MVCGGRGGDIRRQLNHVPGRPVGPARERPADHHCRFRFGGDGGGRRRRTGRLGRRRRLRRAARDRVDLVVAVVPRRSVGLVRKVREGPGVKSGKSGEAHGDVDSVV